jgi:folate-dependent phosphoribosylglycinamide formyltransferase PurN
MAAIMQACEGGCLSGLIKPALVIASSEHAGGIGRALAHGMNQKDIVVVHPREYRTKTHPQQAFGECLLREFNERGITVFGQYGWLCHTPKNVVEACEGFNQHPGPLDPGFEDFGGAGMYGRRVHAARLYYIYHTKQADQFWTEVTAHRVSIEYDKGAVVGRRRVAISPKDDVLTLQSKTIEEEYHLHIETLRLRAQGKLTDIWRDDRVIVPEESHLLREAKRIAILFWPNG